MSAAVRAHQSFFLAQAGYEVIDPSSAMLDKAQQRLQRLPEEAHRRVTLLQADGGNADDAVNGRRFAAVLCHGVLGYLEQPEPLVTQLCRCAAAGGLVSIMTGNAKTMAVRPALERRWDDALAAFNGRTEIGVLGVPSRADTVEEVSQLIRRQGVEPLRWYGVWLFVDWLEFSGAQLDPTDSKQVAATAAVELEASRRDPYRQLSRVFHLVGRKGPTQRGNHSQVLRSARSAAGFRGVRDRVNTHHGPRPAGVTIELSAIWGQRAPAGLGEKLVDEDRPQPLLVPLPTPAPVEDEQAVHLGRRKSVDDVGGVALSEPAPQRARSSE
jgi:S-adenosylmethionine-dependent methyltransferase